MPEHSTQVHEVHERMLGASPARSRSVDMRSGRVHVIEAGDGPPVVFLHGSNTSSLSLLTLIERLEGVRAIAVDRPGFGLSDPVGVARERFREAAVDFVDEVVAELGLPAVALAGNSMGGTWALWYALARPDRVSRVALIGSAPLLPGTRPPAPLRLMATPIAGDVLARVAKPNAKMLVRLLASVGEGDTIVRHPDLIEALVAAGRDPAATTANLAELRACITPAGFRRAMVLRPDELRRLAVPMLIVWGDHDPVGGVEAARAVAGLVPHARLEVLPAGHVPYLGDPGRVAGLLSAFVRSGVSDAAAV